MPLEATRDRLLDAALEVFARKGYEDARVEDVCQAAGSARATFYRHFSGKEEAFVALVERLGVELDAMATAVEPVRPDAAGRDALRRLIDRSLAVSERWSPIIEVLNVPRRLPPSARRAAQGIAASVNHTVGRALRDGLPAGMDPDTAALAVTALIDGVGHQIRTWDLPLDRDEVVDSLTELASQMLHAQPAIA